MTEKQKSKIGNKIFNLRNWAKITLRAVPDDYSRKMNTSSEVLTKEQLSTELDAAITSLMQEIYNL